MSSSVEDAMCVQRIQWEQTAFGNEADVKIETEKHYNHYGDRGVADLFSRRVYENGAEDDHVYEFKSDAAVDSVTGANEIVRQFNRMCSYFYKDEDITPPKPTAWNNATTTFELCFDVTPRTYEHVLENHEIYQTVSKPVVETSLRDARSIVTFRSQDGDRRPVLVASSSESTNISRGEFADMFEEEFGNTMSGWGVTR